MSRAQNFRVVHGAVDGRRGRVFSRPGALTEDETESLLPDPLRRGVAHLLEALSDPDDIARLELLRDELEQGSVAVFAAHRTQGAPDVIQAFLRMPVDGVASKVFACTVISLQRLERDLESTEFVVEDMSNQVASTAGLTHASLEIALQAWCERVLPDREIPRVILDPWDGDVTQPDVATSDTEPCNNNAGTDRR